MGKMQKWTKREKATLPRLRVSISIGIIRGKARKGSCTYSSEFPCTGCMCIFARAYHAKIRGACIYGDVRSKLIYIYIPVIYTSLVLPTTRVTKTNGGFMHLTGVIAPFPRYARRKMHVHPVHVDAGIYVCEAVWALLTDYANGKANTCKHVNECAFPSRLSCTFTFVSPTIGIESDTHTFDVHDVFQKKPFSRAENERFPIYV